MVELGFWQLGASTRSEILRTLIEERIDAPVAPVGDLRPCQWRG